MPDSSEKERELIKENESLRKRIRELEMLGAERNGEIDALRDKELQLRFIAEKIPVVIFQYYSKSDGTFGLTYLSDGFKSIFGLDKDAQDPIRQFEARLAPESVKSFTESITKAVKEVKSWSFEGRFIKEDGTSIWFLGMSNPLKKEREIIFNGVLLDITERKQAEESLRASEANMQALIENTEDVIALYDRDMRLQIYNTACRNNYYRVLGIEIHPGLRVLDFVPESRKAQWIRNNTRALAGESFFSEHIVTTIDNQKLSFEISYNPIRKGSEVVGYSTFSKDVTERKRAELALQESEAKFRDLAEKSVVGIYLIQDNLFQYVNAEFANMCGCKPEDIIGLLGPGDLTFQEDYLLVKENISKRISGEIKSLRYEFRILTRDGKIRQVEVFSSQTVYQGKPAIIGTMLDITDRKKAEEELRRLSIAIEQAEEDIVITNVEGIIDYVNPAFEKITGYSRDEAIGRTPRILKSGVHNPLFYEKLWHTIKDGRIWRGRFVNRCKDGKLILEDAIVSPLITSAGKLTGYVALKRDVTDTVKLENHLRQGQKMEAIGTLAGGIAHDFNNMLAAMMGFAEMIKMKTTDRAIGPYLEQILNACNRSRDLVKQILTFSRKGEQEKKPVSVIPIVKEAMKLLRPSIPTTIEIRQHYNARQDTVLADPTQIHQVLMNLCTNAVHAMRERGGTLEVFLNQCEFSSYDAQYHPELREGTYLQLTVMDTGTGIDHNIKDRIFDPFFTTKALGEGTGLGLSVVYGIIKDCGGTISVDSELEKGTVFTINLPVIVVGEMGSANNISDIPGGKGRILYVDDEEPIATFGHDLLTTLGYDVSVRLSSLDALEAFKANPEKFDMVITDMTMPHMTGALLARELLKVRPDIPIILTTGYSEMINDEAAKKIGIREYLMKPVSVNSLAAAVKKHLGQQE